MCVPNNIQIILSKNWLKLDVKPEKSVIIMRLVPNNYLNEKTKNVSKDIESLSNKMYYLT